MLSEMGPWFSFAFPSCFLPLLIGLSRSSNLLYAVSITHQELAKPACNNFSDSFLDVPPAESIILSFIHPTGWLTMNKLKMVIPLSWSTTWRHTQSRTCAYTNTCGCTQGGEIHADKLVLMEKRIEASQNCRLGIFALNCVSRQVLSLKLSPSFISLHTVCPYRSDSKPSKGPRLLYENKLQS